MFSFCLYLVLTCYVIRGRGTEDEDGNKDDPKGKEKVRDDDEGTTGGGDKDDIMDEEEPDKAADPEGWLRYRKRKWKKMRELRKKVIYSASFM